MRDNIILIGMPGSGKSTVGVQLAKHLGLDFIDTDLLIQTNQGKRLQEIIDTQGSEALKDIEEQELLQLQLSGHMVATGGSAVYSDAAMQNVKKQGLVVYLSISFDEMTKRIDNEGDRGITRPPGYSLEDVYNERLPLYEKYADITLNNEKRLTMKFITEKINHFKTNKS